MFSKKNIVFFLVILASSVMGYPVSENLSVLMEYYKDEGTTEPQQHVSVPEQACNHVSKEAEDVDCVQIMSQINNYKTVNRDTSNPSLKIIVTLPVEAKNGVSYKSVTCSDCHEKANEEIIIEIGRVLGLKIGEYKFSDEKWVFHEAKPVSRPEETRSRDLPFYSKKRKDIVVLK